MNLKSLIPIGRERGMARPDLFPFTSLQREIDRLFEDFTRGFPALASTDAPTLVPSMDVTETDKEIEITAELPGLEEKDVQINLADNVLTIRGEKKAEKIIAAAKERRKELDAQAEEEAQAREKEAHLGAEAGQDAAAGEAAPDKEEGEEADDQQGIAAEPRAGTSGYTWATEHQRLLATSNHGSQSENFLAHRRAGLPRGDSI